MLSASGASQTLESITAELLRERCRGVAGFARTECASSPTWGTHSPSWFYSEQRAYLEVAARSARRGRSLPRKEPVTVGGPSTNMHRSFGRVRDKRRQTMRAALARAPTIS
jgi:hypothetical protein